MAAEHWGFGCRKIPPAGCRSSEIGLLIAGRVFDPVFDPIFTLSLRALYPG